MKTYRSVFEFDLHVGNALLDFVSVATRSKAAIRWGRREKGAMRGRRQRKEGIVISIEKVSYCKNLQTLNSQLQNLNSQLQKI